MKTFPRIPPPYEPDSGDDDQPYRSLVKISGDLAEREDVALWVTRLAVERARQFPEKGAEILAVVGGGTQINRAFAAAGIPYRKHSPLGRVAANARERDIIRATLAQTRNTFLTLLQEARTKVPPGETLAGITCSAPTVGILPLNPKLYPRWIHVNGDTYVETCYCDQEELFVLTVMARHESKTDRFQHLPKVVVEGFPDQPPAP